MSLQELIINKYIEDYNLPIDDLPEDIKRDIKIQRDDIFMDKAFKDVAKYLNNQPMYIRQSPKGFTFYYESSSRCDINYFMFKIRDRPNVLLELGYTKYNFSVEYSHIDGDDDYLYILTIIDPETNYKVLYIKSIGRFD